MLLWKYTRVALEVLGMDVNVLDGDRYRHHYTPPCLHSLSLRCHSIHLSFFCQGSASSIALPTTSSSSAQSLSFTFTLHYPPVCVVISMPFHFPEHTGSLATNRCYQFLEVPTSHFSLWYWGMDGKTGQVLVPVPTIKIKTVKRDNKCAHAALLICWCLSGDTPWEQPRLAVGLKNFNFTYQFYLTLALEGRVGGMWIRQWTQILQWKPLLILKSCSIINRVWTDVNFYF